MLLRHDDGIGPMESSVIETKAAVTLSPGEGVPQARRLFEEAVRLKRNAIAQ